MNIKTWHFLVGWVVAAGIAIPAGRMVRHMNQPPVEVRTEVRDVLRATVDAKSVYIKRKGQSSTAESVEHRLHNGTITVLEDAATDADMWMEIVSVHTPSMIEDTENTTPISRSFVLHLNPKGKQSSYIWITEAQLLSDKREEAERKDIVSRRGCEIEFVKQAELVKKRWAEEDGKRPDRKILRTTMESYISVKEKEQP